MVIPLRILNGYGIWMHFMEGVPNITNVRFNILYWGNYSNWTMYDKLMVKALKVSILSWYWYMVYYVKWLGPIALIKINIRIHNYFVQTDRSRMLIYYRTGTIYLVYISIVCLDQLKRYWRGENTTNSTHLCSQIITSVSDHTNSFLHF